MKKSFWYETTHEDTKQQRTLDYKEKAVELLHKSEISEKDLIELSKMLRANLDCEVEFKDKLMTKDSFEMLEKNYKN